MRNVLIKIGGSTVNSEGFLEELARSLHEVKETHRITLVHGGGKDIAAEFERLGRSFEFVEGLRVTDANTVDAVQRALSGGVNKRIVNVLETAGVPAVGISGVDGAMLEAERISAAGRDIGFVGRIHRVDGALPDILEDAGYVPVISPVSRDREGALYNVNADDAAAEIAVARGVDDLIYISDVAGVRIGTETVSVLGVDDIERQIEAGEITGGMIPKLRSAADCRQRGVQRIHITGWYGEHTLRGELSAHDHRGTIIQ
ncbi:MAG: acetylglutamate kinase [Fibrobacterota bacterium]